ncbi:MAG: PmoA family protein [Sedimentisphaerales bacterium]|nr:PmoA family protein [Sedimentisphaerales bacterium]
MERFRTTTVISWLLAALSIPNVSADNAQTNQMRAAMDKDVVNVTSGERVLMRYRYNGVPYKPYVDRLLSPSGVNILLDAPADHLHHHALMYAVTADGVNFWEEQQAPGRQVHLKFDDVKVDNRDDVPFAGFSEQLDWAKPASGESLLIEKRTIEATYLPGPKVTLLTWQSVFKPAEGKESVTLTGAHYHGLGLRFIRSMDTNGEFRNADGKAGTVFRGEELLVRSRWCAYTAEADGKQVTVAMFDHPENQRHPATWFTMKTPFAYLSATLNLHEQPLKVIAGKPLFLRYAVAIWDGSPGKDEIDNLYKLWAATPKM